MRVHFPCWGGGIWWRRSRSSSTVVYGLHGFFEERGKSAFPSPKTFSKYLIFHSYFIGLVIATSLTSYSAYNCGEGWGCEIAASPLGCDAKDSSVGCIRGANAKIYSCLLLLYHFFWSILSSSAALFYSTRKCSFKSAILIYLTSVDIRMMPFPSVWACKEYISPVLTS